MGLIEIALTLLILLLAVFLGITGVQVFFILRDLKKALDKLNGVLQTGEKIVEDVEKPISAASGVAKVLGRVFQKKEKPKRFYKRTL